MNRVQRSQLGFVKNRPCCKIIWESRRTSRSMRVRRSRDASQKYGWTCQTFSNWNRRKTFHRRCNLSATEQEFQEHIEWLTKKWRARFTCLTLRITVYKANIQAMSGCCLVLMEKLGVMLREKNPKSLINQTMRWFLEEEYVRLQAKNLPYYAIAWLSLLIEEM